MRERAIVALIRTDAANASKSSAIHEYWKHQAHTATVGRVSFFRFKSLWTPGDETPETVAGAAADQIKGVLDRLVPKAF